LPDENSPAFPTGPEKTTIPENAAEPNFERPSLPADSGIQLDAPAEPLRRTMKKYITKQYADRRPRYGEWHAPKKATYGKKEGLLYRVEFSILVPNLYQGREERQSLNYYVFVVNGKIVTGEALRGGWETVKTFKILGNP